MKTFENSKHIESLQKSWAIFSGHKRDEVSEFNSEDCVYLAAVGFLNGLALWLCAQTVLFFQQQSNAGAIILGSFIINGLLSWSNNFYILKFGESTSKAYEIAHQQAPTAITQIVILFRLAAVAYLLHKGLSWWLIIIPLFPAYFLSIRFLSELKNKNTNLTNTCLYLTIGLAVLPSFFNHQLIPIALCFVVCYFASPYISKHLQGLEFEDQINTHREYIELISFCIALILLK
ncbi:hypothetical protein PQO03_15345 [Lentisphaera profundi]|uniref:Prenyltransferase n=1 Tax=Lentisphaera profundi TaxID=1658616 RepID=A0ABY7W0X7_9BACT|nr:hypothetical protein [Lentisphaera profundi]WDE99209.1 hypothetical protein PQO03_15345 [Lentisphaera profundi]